MDITSDENANVCVGITSEVYGSIVVDVFSSAPVMTSEDDADDDAVLVSAPALVASRCVLPPSVNNVKDEVLAL